MRHKRMIACTLVFIILSVLLCAPSMAGGKQQSDVTYFEDGSYLVRTVIEIASDYAASQTATEYTKSGIATEGYYNSKDELVWSLSVHGTFTYDGTTAEATAARYSYEINDSDWSFKSGSASYSGATATANGTFLYLKLWPNTDSVSLACSPKGVLS